MSNDPIFDAEPTPDHKSKRARKVDLLDGEPAPVAVDPLAQARIAVTDARKALDQARQAVLDAETVYGRAVAALVALESPPVQARDGQVPSDLDRRRQTAKIAAVLAATGDGARMKSAGSLKARTMRPRPQAVFFRRGTRA